MKPFVGLRVSERHWGDDIVVVSVVPDGKNSYKVGVRGKIGKNLWSEMVQTSEYPKYFNLFNWNYKCKD